ncbi:flavin-binding monooxygenase-like family protein [Rhodococcus sp. MTM3W5.2]|uniref:flavin-containing monooxygenase n=1 Tax=Rhodococcus sp. MTM3W5.2 TaxID=1805827 RepID=UPI00097975BB|nr:NAD(P)/FAD-dependent oxidoreductase [Rhodococcus sp. MTM3W5.2]AQA20763.1 flavin-binding monooxygenase-like family protein [Rhodococcus sp. MTM3W5.2]
MAIDHFDVLIVGAGLSGIGAGYHLQARCPDKTYAILEARGAIGGTWDLFRYPGVRSDSDMYTLGYSFRPWTDAKSIADGPSILSYVRATAREQGIDRKIRFDHRVTRAEWSSEDARWTVEAQRGPTAEIVRFTCNFLFMCSGYYDYREGYTPEFAGVDRFAGRVVHPQHWPDDIDWAGKRVVVIGSGATAVTLVPAIAESAAHVTMLQRSPSYVLSVPDEDVMANRLRAVLPSKLAYGIVRWKNVLRFMLFFTMSRRAPGVVKRLLRRQVQAQLPAGFDVDAHFTPRYDPWDQRMCFVPHGDLFRAIRHGRADIVTDRIETFTERGISLASGTELAADIIVTATGLKLIVGGGVELSVDGAPVDAAKALSYKGMMLSDVPNFASCIGYTNASWTLKCDLTCEYVCRLLNHMAANGYRQCTPRNVDPSITTMPIIDFSSGYVQRSIHEFPKQGSKKPWRLYQNYALDIAMLKFGSVDDAMEFVRTDAAGARRADVVG